MRAQHLLLALLLFTAGLGSGWWLAIQQISRSDPAVRSAAIPAPAPAPEQPLKYSDVQWLTVETASSSTTIPAVIVKDRGVMIASLYKVYGASRVFWRDRHSDTLIFPRVIAAGERIPLVALSWEGPADAGLALSPESASLFLGKDAVLRLPNERVPVTVQSSLIRDNRGNESYLVDLQAPTAASDGPLVERQSATLIGFLAADRAASSTGTSLRHAIDAVQIARLIEQQRLPAPMTPGAFNALWADSDDGLRLGAEQQFAAGNWEQAYRLAERLWQSTSKFDEQDRYILTTSAYLYAHELIAGNRATEALGSIAPLLPSFPNDKAWCLVNARAYQILANWQAAISAVENCLSSSPVWPSAVDSDLALAESRAGLVTLMRALVLQLNADASQSQASKIAALQRAIELQPYAALYQALGDIQYDLRAYAQAQRNYELAIDLDPSLGSQLANRLQNSRQRASTLPVAEVPIEARRGSIVVSGRLNDSPQNFRLLVDTGATYSAVSRATLLRLGLSDVFSRGAPVIELESAAGPIYVQRFELQAIALGDARVENVPVVILENLEGVDGLIGLSFLRHFGVDLDQQAGKLILTRL